MAAPALDSAAEVSRVVEQLFTEPCVLVFVRGEKEPFSIPKALLTAASPVAERICEKNDDTMVLKQSSDAFRTLVGWMLKRAIVSTDQAVLTEAYALGKALEIPAFFNPVFKALQNQVDADKKVSPQAMAIAFSYPKFKTLQQRLLRQVTDGIVAESVQGDLRADWGMSDLTEAGLEDNNAFLREAFDQLTSAHRRKRRREVPAEMPPSI